MKNKLKIILIVVIFLSFSCQKEKEIDLSEDRGTLLTSQIPTDFINLIWSKNTDEIITAGRTGIHAINIYTHAVRAVEITDDVYHIELSNDGNTIYYILTGANLYGDVKPLYSISLDGKDRQLILNNVYVSDFSLSPENLIVYHSAADSLYLYNNISKSKTFLTIGIPVTFSPDGKQLLYFDFTGDFLILYTISIENRTIQQIALFKEYYYYGPRMYRWDESGIWVFYKGNDAHFYIKNFTTNETSDLWQPSLGEGPIMETWSPDGEKIAYWTQRCIKYGEGIFADCEIIQSTVHIFDINKSMESRIAYGNADFVVSMAFSPDSKKIVYGFGSQIYTKDIP